MVAPAACWAGFGELQARELQEWGYPDVHGLAVDAYAASHGGDGDERRDRQSVAIHLLALQAVLEEHATAQARVALLQRLTRVKRDWPRLDRPEGVPTRSWQHAAAAASLEDYERRVREWAQAVWDFWTPARPALRGIA